MICEKKTLIESEILYEVKSGGKIIIFKHFYLKQCSPISDPA